MNYMRIFKSGDRIELSDLKTEKYNGLRGIVRGFDEGTQRYKVELDNKRTVKIQGKNALFLFPSRTCNSAKYCEFQARIGSANNTEDVLHILEELPKHTDFAPYQLFDLILHVKNVLGDRHHVPSVQEIFIKAFARVLETTESASDRTRIQTKLQLAKLHDNLEQWEEYEKVILSCLEMENHFGFTPAINAAWARIAFHKRNYEEVIKLFQETQPYLTTGNYSPTEPFFSLQSSTLEAAMRLGKTDIADQALSQLRSENVYVPLSVMQRFEAGLAIRHGKYEEALAILEELQRNVELTSGVTACSRVDLLCRRAECLALLKKTNLAKECLREAKKQSVLQPGFEDHIAIIENLIARVHTDAKKKRNQDKHLFNSKAKCSNPSCNNREERMKQFQVCAQCRSARYCSRECQKIHWKSGHKNFCKKIELQ